ncbi:MAG: hypothetical protein B6D61_05085 [Bacteroidetes bacterium 4484_249]|nr:MAG: hypothetical protein B6D61_05085 [Bacteroidetes bacterium 4484_249]
MFKKLLLNGLTMFFLISVIPAWGQTDTVRSHKIKFDWELGPPGAGVNFSFPGKTMNSFGFGINSLYITYIFLPSGQNGEDSWPWINFDLINSKIFYRKIISKYITFEYSIKYSYSHFGCVSCYPENVQLYGLQFAPIFGTGKVKYKPIIAITRSVENPTFFIYIMPLVFNFNL